MVKLFRQSALEAFNSDGGAAVVEAAGLKVIEKPFVEKLMLQGDARSLAAALEKTFGIALPDRPNTCIDGATARCLWLRPGQWLMLGNEGGLPAHLKLLQGACDNTGAGYVTDVTDRYQVLTVSGQAARSLLATGCSLNLNDRAFACGQCAQSRIEQVPVILYRHRDNFTLLVERPLAHHLWLWVRAACREFGYPEENKDETMVKDRLI